jgi:hypothetical protein
MKAAIVVISTAAVAGLGGAIIDLYAKHREPTVYLWSTLAFAAFTCASSVFKYRKNVPH